MGRGLGRVIFFFFSSRRRHTRFDCDWSSDVCSSDLARPGRGDRVLLGRGPELPVRHEQPVAAGVRSEEHTSELQSQSNLACRLLLEKKKMSSYNTSQTWQASGLEYCICALTRC